MILSQTFGNYSQTIRIGCYKNEVEITKNGKELFKGGATHIVDNGGKISFKDINGKQYEFVKYIICTYT